MTQRARTLLQHLLDLNGQTFKEGRYQVAHHLLAAAMHLAEEIGDIPGVEDIERRSVAQQSAVDETMPAHSLSSRSARHRGTQALFTSLGRTAHAAAGRLRAESARQRADAAIREARTYHPSTGSSGDE